MYLRCDYNVLIQHLVKDLLITNIQSRLLACFIYYNIFFECDIYYYDTIDNTIDVTISNLC